MQRQGSQRDAVAIWKQWPLRPSVSIGRTRRPPRSKDFSPRSKYFYCIWHLHQVLKIRTSPTTASPRPALAVAPPFPSLPPLAIKLVAYGELALIQSIKRSS